MADIENTVPKAAEAPVKAADSVNRIAEPAVRKVERLADKASEKIASGTEKVVAEAKTEMANLQAQMGEGFNRAADLAREMAEAQRNAMETAVKASQIYTEGMQKIATHAAEVGRSQLEEAMAHLRSLSTAKTVQEAMEMQANFARHTASRLLNEGSVFMEDYLNVAGRALAPVATRAREVANKVERAA